MPARLGTSPDYWDSPNLAVCNRVQEQQQYPDSMPTLVMHHAERACSDCAFGHVCSLRTCSANTLYRPRCSTAKAGGGDRRHWGSETADNTFGMPKPLPLWNLGTGMELFRTALAHKHPLPAL